MFFFTLHFRRINYGLILDKHKHDQGRQGKRKSVNLCCAQDYNRCGAKIF